MSARRVVPTILAALAAATLLATACAPDGSLDARSGATAVPTTRIPHAPDDPFTLTTLPHGDLVYASSRSSFVALDGGSGGPRYERPASLLSADGTDLFTTEVIAESTNVVSSDPATGEARWSTTLAGAWTGRVVAPNGGQLALLPVEVPASSGPGVEDGYLAPSRTRSSIVVTSRDGNAPLRFDLDGNYEPEAFAVDGSALYLVEFTPAQQPDHYTVRRLDLRTGFVDGVYGNNKELQGAMPGRSRNFVSAPDGHARYTLYTMLMPPDGHDPRGGHPPGPPHAAGETHGFVHVLDMRYGTADCIDLPRPFGLQDPEGLAIAADPTGAWFAVADVDTGVLGIVDVNQRLLVRTLPIDTMAGGRTSLATTADGRLVVARGTTIAVLDAGGRRVASWEAPAAVDSLTVSAAPSRIYVSAAGRIHAYDLTGTPLADLPPLA